MRNDVTYSVSGAGLTVPAGGFEAYLVELALDMNSNMTGSVNRTAEYWFVSGFGLVRQVTTVAGPAMVTRHATTSTRRSSS